MMENPMSKEANALLLKLLASGIDAAGVHCSRVPDPPKPDEGPCEPEEPDDDDDKDDKTIRFL